MLKTIFFSMLIRIVGILLGFVIPAVVIRYYNHDEFGLYSYVLTFLVVVSVLQSGFTASYRNKIISLSNHDKNVLFSMLYIRVFKIYIGSIFLLSPLVFIFYFFDENIYYYVSLFLVLSLINVFYPVLSIYFDSINKSVLFSLLEVCLSFFVLVLVVICCFYKVNVVWVAIIWSVYKGVGSFIICYFIRTNNFSAYIRDKFKDFKFFHINDFHFTFNQIINVLITLLFMNTVLKFSSITDYGYFSVYYRFVFFPSQILGTVAGIIWVRYNSMNVNDKYKEFINLGVLFLVSVSLWSIVCYLFMERFVYLYSSESISYIWNYALFLLLMILFLTKDYLSIYLNAYSNMVEQLGFNIFVLLCISGVFLFCKSVDELIAIYVFCLFIQVIYFYYLIRRGQKNEK